jgi:hypothetical protein
VLSDDLTALAANIADPARLADFIASADHDHDAGQAAVAGDAGFTR